MPPTIKTILLVWACLVSVGGRRVHTSIAQARNSSCEEHRNSQQVKNARSRSNSLAEIDKSGQSPTSKRKKAGIHVTGPGQILAGNDPSSKASHVTEKRSTDEQAEHPIEGDLASAVSDRKSNNETGLDMAAASLKFVLSTAASVIPHPKKAARRYELEPHCGGEDSYFVNDAAGVIGVADGVGGWANQGVDAGFYSRQLMKLAADEVQLGNLEPYDILKHAHARTTHLGSSTSIILSFFSESSKSKGPSKIKIANLGDSGFLLVRRGKAIFKSLPQQHSFNFPFQLASPRVGTGDDPKDAQQITIEYVKERDLLILGSDGLFDNAFPDEIASIVRQVKEVQGTGSLVQAVAEEIAKQTSVWAQDKQRQSPFAEDAKRYGYKHRGGKLDDITVLVAEIIKNPRFEGYKSML